MIAQRVAGFARASRGVLYLWSRKPGCGKTHLIVAAIRLAGLCLTDARFAWVRYLDPGNLKSQKKSFYGTNILTELDKHYSQK